MTKINILEFSHQRGFGGTDSHSQLMLKYYNKDKFNIFACSYEGGFRQKWIEDNNIPNIVTQNDVELAKWIRTNKIDVVHLYRGGWTENRDITLLKMAKVPVIVEQNCFATFDASGNNDDISAHIFCSNISHEIYKRNAGEQYNPEKSYTVYCPIETGLFDVCDINYNNNVFGRFSRPDINKWHEINIQSLPLIKQQIPDAKFNVIGLPNEWNINDDMLIKYPAFNSDQEQIDFLNTISIFAHSSRIGESFGNNIAESMAAGLPIVTHSGGDSAQTELVTYGYNGYIVEPEDYQGYAEKIIYLLKHPDIKKQMGQNSKKRAKEWFDPFVTVKQFEDIYIEHFKRKQQ